MSTKNIYQIYWIFFTLTTWNLQLKRDRGVTCKFHLKDNFIGFMLVSFGLNSTNIFRSLLFSIIHCTGIVELLQATNGLQPFGSFFVLIVLISHFSSYSQTQQRWEHLFSSNLPTVMLGGQTILWNNIWIYFLHDDKKAL